MPLKPRTIDQLNEFCFYSNSERPTANHNTPIYYPKAPHPRYIEVKNCRENASDTLILDRGVTQHRRPQEFYKNARDCEKKMVVLDADRLFEL
jgi:hypothetical protein